VRTAALWAGTKTPGLAITPGVAATDDAVGAVQTWTVTEGRTKIAEVTVTWVTTDNGWKLAALPTF